MLHARKSLLISRLTAVLAIISFISAMSPLMAVSAQDLGNTSILPLSAMTMTPAFIDDNFKPVLGGLAGSINRMLIQPDGKTLVAGNFHLVNGAPHSFIARFNVDGSVDSTFNSTGGQNNTITAMGLQSDGKIVIGGNFTSIANQAAGDIARLNTDGSFDSTFNSGGAYNNVGANNTISEISIAPDNSIYVGGSFTSYNGIAVNRLAHLTPNGGLDTSFSVGTGPSAGPNAIVQAGGGKLLIGGTFTTYNGTTINRLARINSDGSLDSSFTTGTGPNNQVRTIALQSDGKIIIGGTFASYNSVAKNGLARLNSDGTDDATFSVSGTGALVFSAALQPDGKLIVGGNFGSIGGNTSRGIARLNSNGSLDSSFNAGTGLSNPSPVSAAANAIVLQTDGKVVIGGVFTGYNGTARSSVARTNPDGSLDNSMIPTITAAGNIWSMAKTSDGKLVIGGAFSSVNGTVRANIARLNADGSVDTSFDPGAGATGGGVAVTGVGVQPDGKIIIGGEFTNYNGTAQTGIARLNADGSLDTSFVVGAGQDGDLFTFGFQSDGKILIGGVFTHYAGVAINNLARLNTDGSLDTSLSIGTGPNSAVRRILIQPDNKILVAGDYANFNSSGKSRLTRLNTDGSFDSSFVTGTISNNVKDVLLEASGKLVIVGSFTTINGTTRNRAARLNGDGSLDTSFDPGTGFPADVLGIVPTADNKYIVVGSFTSANGLSRNRMARLRSNGTVDAKFLQGLGPVAQSGLAVRQIMPFNNKFLIAGQFEIFNTSARTGLVLMSNATKAPVDFDGDGITDVAIARQYGGTGPWTWWIKTSAKGAIFTGDYGIFTVDALQPGDFDGDGRTDVAVWTGRGISDRPNGYWITFSSTNQTKFVPFGLDGDRPVLEDYDGDGKDDMAIYRGPFGYVGQTTWIYRGSFNNPNGNFTYVPWGYNWSNVDGGQDDIMPGDVDGDGKADFRVQRKVDTSIASSNTPGIFYTLTATGAISYDYFGWYSDRTIPGDYDGDGKTDIAIARNFNVCCNLPTTWYFRFTGGAPDTQLNWGAGTLDNFVQGDYDGDGITDVAVYRRANENNYYVLRSSDHTMMVMQWGTADPLGGPASDVPIAVYNNR